MGQVQRHFRVSDSDWRSGRVFPSVGFIPIDPAIREQVLQFHPESLFESGYFFGGALFDKRPGADPRPPFELKLRDGHMVRIVGFPIKYVPHSPADPMDGASAAWAKDPGFRGVLTCKHVVSTYGVGDPVPMKDGTSGTLRSFGSGTVDAAFIETVHRRRMWRSLRIEDDPVDGSLVIAEFRSGTCQAQILSSWYFPDNLDPYNPMRVFIDRSGQPGDSGSLVATGTRRGVGIYAATGVGNGTRQGMCQYLKQAADNLNLKLYL
jgi:hypothetical protein